MFYEVNAVNAVTEVNEVNEDGLDGPLPPTLSAAAAQWSGSLR